MPTEPAAPATRRAAAARPTRGRAAPAANAPRACRAATQRPRRQPARNEHEVPSSSRPIWRRTPRQSGLWTAPRVGFRYGGPRTTGADSFVLRPCSTWRDRAPLVREASRTESAVRTQKWRPADRWAGRYFEPPFCAGSGARNGHCVKAAGARAAAHEPVDDLQNQNSGLLCAWHNTSEFGRGSAQRSKGASQRTHAHAVPGHRG